MVSLHDTIIHCDVRDSLYRVNCRTCYSNERIVGEIWPLRLHCMSHSYLVNLPLQLCTKITDLIMILPISVNNSWENINENHNRCNSLNTSPKHEKKKLKTEGEAPKFLWFSSVWGSLMKHDKRVFELASQTSIRNDLLHVCFTDLYM